VVAFSCADAACAQVDARPTELEGIDIVEHLNQPLPLDLEFVDSAGKTVKLGDYFNRDKPIIITLNYYECPMLCNLQLNGLLGKSATAAQPNRGKLADPGTGIMALDWDLGDEYEIITISFDPEEGTDLARGKEKAYMSAYRREGVQEGWHFLTGSAENSRALADAIGFSYRWNEETNQWLHAAAIFVATPKGRLSRYLYGVSYDPQTLRMALLEASEGKIGNTIDKFLLWCFHYNDKSGQYTLAIMNIMRALGFVTMTVLGVGLFILWRRDQRRQRLAPGSAGGSIDQSRNHPRPQPGAKGVVSFGGHSSI
jgi:protein SCO1/2